VKAARALKLPGSNKKLFYFNLKVRERKRRKEREG
jgi:hypothetical protein